ncbi:hypothetical protein U1Q18_037192 [Sarracenia purpurea var. burkii]
MASTKKAQIDGVGRRSRAKINPCIKSGTKKARQSSSSLVSSLLLLSCQTWKLRSMELCFSVCLLTLHLLVHFQFTLLPNIGEMGSSESTRGSGKSENNPSNAGSDEYLVKKKKIEETVMIGVGDHAITGITNMSVCITVTCDMYQ